MIEIGLHVSLNSRNQHLIDETGKARMEVCGDIEGLNIVIKSDNKNIKMGTRDSPIIEEHARDSGYCIEREDINGSQKQWQ